MKDLLGIYLTIRIFFFISEILTLKFENRFIHAKSLMPTKLIYVRVHSCVCKFFTL